MKHAFSCSIYYFKMGSYDPTSFQITKWWTFLASFVYDLQFMGIREKNTKNIRLTVITAFTAIPSLTKLLRVRRESFFADKSQVTGWN